MSLVQLFFQIQRLLKHFDCSVQFSPHFIYQGQIIESYIYITIKLWPNIAGMYQAGNEKIESVTQAGWAGIASLQIDSPTVYCTVHSTSTYIAISFFCLPDFHQIWVEKEEPLQPEKTEPTCVDSLPRCVELHETAKQGQFSNTIINY